MQSPTSTRPAPVHHQVSAYATAPVMAKTRTQATGHRSPAEPVERDPRHGGGERHDEAGTQPTPPAARAAAADEDDVAERVVRGLLGERGVFVDRSL